MKTDILIVAFLLSTLFSSQAESQVLQLRLFDNTYRIARCLNTSDGIKVLKDTWQEKAFNDRFTLDFDQGIFTWKGEDTYIDKIIDHTISRNRHTFITEHVTGSLTINSYRAVLRLTLLHHDQWVQNTYFCEMIN